MFWRTNLENCRMTIATCKGTSGGTCEGTCKFCLQLAQSNLQTYHAIFTAMFQYCGEKNIRFDPHNPSFHFVASFVIKSLKYGLILYSLHIFNLDLSSILITRIVLSLSFNYYASHNNYHDPDYMVTRNACIEYKIRNLRLPKSQDIN